ncbi:g2583 [Coccomyxa elongata]
MDGFWFMPQVHAAGPTPAPRGGHAAVSVGTNVIIYGGTDRQATPFTDLWVLETAGGHYLWTPIESTSASGVVLQPRSGATMTAIGHKVYLYGGQDPQTGICYDDILVLDTLTWDWDFVEVESGRPPARHSHCTGLFQDHCLLVFGGAGMHGTLGDLWLFNTRTGTWVTPMAEGQAPCQREMHSGTMLTDSRMLVCGGRSASGQVLCDVSIFDGDEMKWTSSIATQFFFCAHSAVLMPIAITTLPHLEATASSTLDIPVKTEPVNGDARGSHIEASSSQPAEQISPVARRPLTQTSPRVILYGGFSGEGITGFVLSLDPATLRVEIVDYGPGAGSTLVKGMRKPATRFAQSAVAVPTNGNSSSPWEMVVVAGVHPEVDLSDIAIWRPQFSQ